MREAIARSIRQAIHQINRSNNFELNVLNTDNQYGIDENNGAQRSANDNSMMDVHTQDLTNVGFNSVKTHSCLYSSSSLIKSTLHRSKLVHTLSTILLQIFVFIIAFNHYYLLSRI